MANPIDLIITKEALKVVDDAIAKVNLLDKTMQEAAQHFIDNGKKMSSATPSGVAGNAENNAAVTAQLKAQSDTIAKLSKELDILNTKLVKLNETRTNGKKLTANQIVQNQAERKAAIETAKANSELIGSYEKLNIKHQQAVRNAQNIGVTYGTTSKQFIKASADANKLDEQLKSLDSTLGKHQRNVGNYASGWNALGNSVNQLSREMPAFANSAQTGFMAISNNIPAFQDAIMELRKGGMSWGGVMKELGKTVFGLTGMISLVTTLLVVLGPKLWDWATGNDDVRKSVDKLNKSYERNDELLKITSRNVDHQITLAKELAKQQGKSLKEINDLDEKGARQKLKNFELERDRRKKDYEDFINTEARKNLYWASPIGFKERLEKEKQRLRELNSVQKNALIRAENDVKEHGLALSEIVAKNKTSEVEEERKANKKKEKVRRDDIEGIEIAYKQVGTTLEQIDKKIDEARTKIITGDSSGVEELAQLIELRKLLNALPTASTTILQPVKKEDVDNLEKLSEGMKEYLSNFTSDFINQSGFTNTFKILNDEIDGFGENTAVTFNAIAESAQEMFNFISNASQANFDGEKERLQNQYDISLKYADDNKAAQEKLAEDLEKSKKDIANREAKAKQQQAIFNIAIDTAQGIVSALASTPPNIILSAVIAGIGAAQIAMVSSQKIPQYWMGGTHDGGLMMVNDGQGANFRETIVTPDGKIMKPQGRNVIMDAPVGTEIFTHDQWQQQLNGMLQGNGINWNSSQHYNGMTKNDMKEALMETLGEQPQYHTNFDGNGVVSYISKRGNVTRLNTNRSNGRGTKF